MDCRSNDQHALLVVWIPVFCSGIGGMIAQSLEEQLFRWLRAAELTCDRAALLVSQDPKVYKTDILNPKNI